MTVPIADRILTSLIRPHVIEGTPINVSASVGVAQWPNDGTIADDLFEFADRALYQVKAEAQASTSPDNEVASYASLSA
jgi:diguanylate cyclase